MTSPFGTLHVLADASAGDGRVSAQLPVLERALDESDLEHAVLLCKSPSELTNAAREVLGAGGRYVVAVGDDASVHHVVNGMFQGGEPLIEDPVLGIVGADTGCDLALSIGLPAGTEAAARHLSGGNTYPFDVMKVTYTTGPDARETTYCHNLAEVGLGAQVARRVNRLPARLGRSRRFLGFWLELLGSRPAVVKVEADRKAFEGRAFNVVVANGQFTSGLRLSPKSFPGDGVLDALVFHGPRSEAYTMLPRMYQHGGHIPHPHIQELRAKVRVAVDADRPLPVVGDGLLLGTTPATFQIIPQRLLLKL